MIHKTTRSILSVLLAALLLIASIPLTPAFADGGGVSLQSESAEGLFAGGTGTEGDPYRISSAEELWDFAKLVNGGKTTAYAILTANIDLSEICGEESDLSWTPIGNSSSNSYEGTFNGNGHTISGLYIDNNADYQGLFGRVSGTVQNLSVSGTVSGRMYVGGIAGQNLGSVINCYNIGEVSGTGVGGVVGYNSGNVQNCYNIGEVSGISVGGVVGDNSGTVKNCYNTGEVGGVSGGESVGGVVGLNRGSSSTVENCYNTGAVSGSGNKYVGGVVGNNDGSGTVKNCYNTGKINGSGWYVGGVVGLNSSSVENCYNTGSVSGTSYVGGVVGWNDSGRVTNCYNTGSVKGSGYWSSGNWVGGVVGQNNVSGIVTNCYNTGTVSSNSNTSDVGGVVGRNFGGVTGCYFLQQNPVIPGIGGGDTDRQTAEPVDNLDALCENFENDNTNTWTISDTLNRPVLKDNHEDDGSEDHPYEIFTAIDLKNFRDLVNDEGGNPNAHAKLMDNIDLKDVCGPELNNGQPVSWTPIGTSSSKPYTGTFDGNGKTIENLYINNTTSANDQGLFGFVGSEGTVQNLTVTGSVSVSVGEDVGGIAGQNNGNVINCAFTGSVSGDLHVGGVVGNNNGGTVTGCIFSGSGSVSGSDSVGGVVGGNSGSNGVVENCYNTGSVSGPNSGTRNYVGGVVGNNEASVTNCYNTGSVSGPDSGFFNAVGGVVGLNSSGDSSASASVTNCYNTGKVTGSADSSDVGGVVGLNSSASVANCYYQTGKGAAVGIGGTTGDNSSQTAAKSLEDFHSGEVAYLLEKGVTDEKPVWGQDLTDKNSLPTLVALDKANAQKVYRLTFNWNMGDQQPDTVRYTNGSVTLPADNEIPTRTGYHISGWKDKNGKPVTAETTVEEDAVFTAEWTANTYTITVTAGSGGTVSGGGNVTHGDSVEVTATANQGYHFVNWTENGTEVSTSATYSFTATANRTLTANFAADAVEPDPEPTPEPEPEEPPYSGKYSYEISTDIGDNGAISVDRYATEGERVTITVTPDEAYKLDDLSVTANGKDVELTANGDGIYSFTMPSADVKITATFAEDPDWTPDEPEEPSTDVSDLFIDIAPDAWYKDAIQYAYDNGLMTGVSDTEFAPEATTTRAMIVSILARLEGVTTAEAAGFADVDDNDWYATAVNWAANVGVVNGYEDNTFRPNTAITREQLAAILMNYAAYKGEDVSARADLTSYTDQPSTWAEEAMSWAVAEGLINGVTADTLQPQGAATRAQVAAILQRFLSE